MTDLVRQDGGKLVFVIQMRQHAARDIDIAARKRHGIDDRTVEHAEGHRSIANLLVGSGPAEMTGGEHAIADFGDVALQFGIAVNDRKALVISLLACLPISVSCCQVKPRKRFSPVAGTISLTQL